MLFIVHLIKKSFSFTGIVYFKILMFFAKSCWLSLFKLTFIPVQSYQGTLDQHVCIHLALST